MIRPVPLQLEQVCSTEKKPWARRTRPLPRQVGQVVGWVPGSAPLPLHVSQVIEVGTRIWAFLPEKASSNSMVRS